VQHNLKIPLFIKYTQVRMEEENQNLKIFVVYHQIVDEDILFTEYSEEYIKKTFAFYCVNEVIEKYETPKRYGLPIIYEYELPKYNPFLQLRHYMETSAYLHIYNNNIHKDLDFIGICQYDMLHVEEYKNLQNDRVYILDSGEPIALNGVWNKKMFPNIRNIDFLLESYNRFFGKNYTPYCINNAPLSLWQTNIYPTQIFEKLCSWLSVLVDEIYPWSIEPPYETHWGVMGGYTERAIAIFNAIEIIERDCKFGLFDVIHTEMCEKMQYDKKFFLQYYDYNVYTKYIDDITTVNIDDLHYSMFKAVYEDERRTGGKDENPEDDENQKYACERICVKGQNGLLFQTKKTNIVYGFEIEAEDPRMVKVNNKIYVVFICLSPYEGQNRCIAITEFEKFEPTYLQVETMEKNPIEKNWAPFEKDGKLYFVYNYDPLVILTYDFNKDGICKVIYKQNNIGLPINTETTFLRGGSNLLHYRDNYYIGGCHSRIHDGSRFYHFTHIVLLDVVNWTIVYLSKPIIYNYKKNDIICINGTNVLFDMKPNCIQDPVSIYKKNNKYYITVNIRDSITHLYEIQFDIPESCVKKYEMGELQSLTEKYSLDLLSSLILKIPKV
jgi:hypothetical protein